MTSKNQKTLIFDLLKICRVCLCSNGVKYVLNSEYLMILKKITHLEFEISEELPQNICKECSMKLEDISQFIFICKRSYTHLRYIVEENKSLYQTLDDKPLLENMYLKIIDEKVQGSQNTEFQPPNTNKITVTSKQDGKEYPQRSFKQHCIEDSCCDTCGKKFTRLSGLERHMRMHSGIKPFGCKTCGTCFSQKATLDRHYLTHTGDKPFECNLCGKVGRRRDQIVEHIQKQHPNVMEFDLAVTQHHKNVFGDTRTEKKRGETTSSNTETTSSNTETSSSNTEKQVLSPAERNKISETKKRVEISLCNLCGKVFQRRGYLKNHMAIHAEVKPFVCSICGRGFTQRHALSRHKFVHSKERPFQCNLCGKTFTRREILVEHIKNHESKTSYLCFHCGKKFSNKYYLKKHLNYYSSGNNKCNSDNKKCICPHCGKQLHSISYLKTHIRMHTGEKPFKCNVCGNRFTIQRSLNHHMNIHMGIKPYGCSECNKAFRTSGSLKKHELLHSGERPYKCTTCDKGFIRRSHLQRHFRTHLLSGDAKGTE